MNLNRKWAFASVLALGTVAGAAAAGCGDDSTSTATKDGGVVDSSSPATDGSPDDTDSGTDSGPADAGYYEALGGHDGIKLAVGQVVAAVAADPQLLSYFAIRTGGVGPSQATGGDPSLDAVEECFTELISSIFNNTITYPTTIDAGGSATFQCRAMGPAHAGLGITTIAFTKFFTIAAGVLQADVAAGKIPAGAVTALAPVLTAQQDTIVDSVRDGIVNPDAGNTSNNPYANGLDAAAPPYYAASCNAIYGQYDGGLISSGGTTTVNFAFDGGGPDADIPAAAAACGQ